MSTTAAELQQKQLQQAEELLFSGPQKAGFAKELFFGRFLTPAMLPYPQLAPTEYEIGSRAVAEVRDFVEQHLDAAKIDQEADIPADVIQGLARLGVMGMTVSPENGGRGFSQQNYSRVMEVIGGHCASTAVFINAHHSIGLRGLALFGHLRRVWMADALASEFRRELRRRGLLMATPARRRG